MDFTLSEEQQLLRSTLNQFLTRRYPFAQRVAASRSDHGYNDAFWKSLADEIGLLGLLVPAGNGGLGGGAVEQMIAMEELGRALVIEPFAETAVHAAGLLERCGAVDLLAAIVSGAARLAIAVGEPTMRYDLEDIGAAAVRSGNGWRLDGTKAVVTAAPWATHLIVAARTSGSAGDAEGLSLFLIEANAPGVTLHAYATIDGRRAADIDFAGVEISADALIGAEGGALPLLEEFRDRAIAAQAAEAAGLLDRLLVDTLEYTKQRQQFGQPIARFQVLQHRMVDMFMQVELVRSAALLAALKLDAAPTERALAASATKVTVAAACRFVGQSAVQLHGAMGMTDELPIGHYFKRATVMEAEFGSADWHLARHVQFSARAD